MVCSACGCQLRVEDTKGRVSLPGSLCEGRAMLQMTIPTEVWFMLGWISFYFFESYPYLIYFICVSNMPYKYVCTPFVCLVPWRPEEGTESPRTGFTEGCAAR